MILHIDMDAFFAQIEQIDNPELKGKPVIIGNNSNRGVVSTASYEARKYGIHSAMPVFQAKKLCPKGIFVPTRMERYREVSYKIMNLLTNFSPIVEPVSIDEAYIDITGCSRLFGDNRQIALKIKKTIFNDTQLTSSIGIAPVRFLAKIASDINKPDGITIISDNHMYNFILSLPVKKIPGIGKKAQKALQLIGILTMQDVKNCPMPILLKKLGKSGIRLKEFANGIDKTPILFSNRIKSVSTEETLSENTWSKEILKKFILKQSETIGHRLRKKKLKAKTINIKIKESDFKLIVRSTTILTPTNTSIIIFREALKLFDNYPFIKKIRLIGVGTSGLVPENFPIQEDLFQEEENPDKKWEEVDKTVDLVTQRFGDNFISKASYIN